MPINVNVRDFLVIVTVVCTERYNTVRLAFSVVAGQRSLSLIEDGTKTVEVGKGEH